MILTFAGIIFLIAEIIEFEHDNTNIKAKDITIALSTFTVTANAEQMPNTCLVIGLLSKYFVQSIISRISGALIGSLVFFLITNFGVWSLGTYGYTINGLILCYTLAIPFFSYSLISTFIFSGIIETVYKFLLIKKFSFIKL